MVTEIKYTRQVAALGRNGFMYQVGMEIATSSRLGADNIARTILILRPLNTRGVGEASQEIPLEDIDLLINALNKIKNDSTSSAD